MPRKHCKRVQIAHECIHALSSHYSVVDTVCIMSVVAYTLSHVLTLCNGKRDVSNSSEVMIE